MSIIASHPNTDEIVADMPGDAAIKVCALAFTSGSVAVIINSFGPISFCGRLLVSRSQQSELVRRLHGWRKETGWPVQRLIDELESHWALTTSE